MPLTPDEVTTLEAGRSHYGCGWNGCLKCYPIQYCCEACGAAFAHPIANGERHTCPECEWVNNEEEDLWH